MENKLIRSKYFLYLTEFFAGMSVMAVELGASRLMAPYFSSSQIVWTVIIGVIMIAMAIGNVWGGKLADKSATDDKAPVEVLGMRVLDELIGDELNYYKDELRTGGLSALLGN